MSYPPPGSQEGYAESRPRNGMGTAALVLGILGILLSIFLVGGLLGVLAIILGVVGLGRARRGEANNRGVAIGGIVTGVIAVLLVGALIALGVAFFQANEDEFNNLQDCLEQADGQADEENCREQFQEELEQ